MALNKKNLSVSTLDSSIDNSVTSFDVIDGSVFPSAGSGNTFFIRINDEVMSVTNKSTNTFTVVRGQESTVAASHTAGDTVAHVLTAGGFDTYVAQALNPYPQDLNLASGFVIKPNTSGDPIVLEIGTGALQLIESGNARGTKAIELQGSRSVSSQVASGDGACILGSNNLADGDNSVVIGNYSEAHGLRSYAIGNGCNVNSSSTDSYAIGNTNNISGSGCHFYGTSNGGYLPVNSYVFGYGNQSSECNYAMTFGANANISRDYTINLGHRPIDNCITNGNGYNLGFNLDAHRLMILPLQGQTTDATPLKLKGTLDNGSTFTGMFESAGECIISLTGQITAFSITSGEYAAFEIKGTYMYQSGTATQLYSNVQDLSNISGLSLTLTTPGNSEVFDVTATGLADNTINWRGYVMINAQFDSISAGTGGA